MPTYEYICPKCKDKIEIVHKMSENCNSVCKQCLIQMNKCVGGGSALHFKGSGFYATDYK